jgi:Carboxypeptidase regulatory-like domain/TonB-dependent Receptor Plug Domain
MGFTCGHRTRRAVVLVLAVISIPTVTRAQGGVVRGVLYDDASGKPIRGTLMLIDPRSDAAVAYTPTDSAGAFTLQVREGVYQISAVRPGYKSVLSAPVPLQNGERLTIRVPIAENGDPEHRIGVTEHIRPNASASQARDANVPSGFESRRASGAGLHYDRDQLTRHGEETLGQFLQLVPGLTVPDPSGVSSVQMSRNAYAPQVSFQGSMVPCHVGWFLDGQRIDLPGQSDPLTDGLGSLRIDVIEAVEVFRGVSEMPAQFAAPDLRCGAIAVWMRKG